MSHFFENFTTSQFADVVFQSNVKIMRNSMGILNWRRKLYFYQSRIKRLFFALLANKDWKFYLCKISLNLRSFLPRKFLLLKYPNLIFNVCDKCIQDHQFSFWMFCLKQLKMITISLLFCFEMFFDFKTPALRSFFLSLARPLN